MITFALGSINLENLVSKQIPLRIMPRLCIGVLHSIVYHSLNPILFPLLCRIRIDSEALGSEIQVPPRASVKTPFP